MPKSLVHFSAGVLLLLGVGKSGLHAQEMALSAAQTRTEGNAGMRWEVAPGAGFMGASPFLSLRGAMRYGGLDLEMAGEQVMGRTATLYPVVANVLLNLSRSGRVTPYGLVGGGLFLTVAENSLGDRMVSTVGLNFGAGLRYRLTDRLGLRFETKQYMTELENRGENRRELLIFQGTGLGLVFLSG